MDDVLKTHELAQIHYWYLSTPKPSSFFFRNAGPFISYITSLMQPPTMSAINLKCHINLSSNPDRFPTYASIKLIPFPLSLLPVNLYQ